MFRSFLFKMVIVSVFVSVGLQAMQPDIDREQALLFDQIQPLLAAEQFDQARDAVLSSPRADVFAAGLLQIIDDTQASAGSLLAEGAPVVVTESLPADLPRESDTTAAERALRLIQNAEYESVAYHARVNEETVQQLTDEIELLQARIQTSEELISRTVFEPMIKAIADGGDRITEQQRDALNRAVEQATAEALELNIAQHAAQLDELVQRALELYKTNDPQAPQALQRVVDVTPQESPVHQRMLRFLHFGQLRQTV